MVSHNVKNDTTASPPMTPALFMETISASLGMSTEYHRGWKTQFEIRELGVFQGEKPIKMAKPEGLREPWELVQQLLRGSAGESRPVVDHREQIIDIDILIAIEIRRAIGARAPGIDHAQQVIDIHIAIAVAIALSGSA
jgi:hypothetical protein